MPSEPVTNGGGAAADGDISGHLPLPLLRSQLIPPAPNRRKSAIDFLHDFGGASWIAHGASSLLVISHFPSPHSQHEAEIGPFFRQLIEPSPCDAGDGPAEVNSVSWCPAVPTDGVVAAAAGNRVWLYSPEPGEGLGSFSWRQSVAFVQSFTIEAIDWTGSGDGLIVVGIEVVLWTRKNTSWEMSWKLKADVPQTLVSASWFAEGPVATAAHMLVHSGEMYKKEPSLLFKEECKRVVVYHKDGKSGIGKVPLCHPQPVSMIRWRPSNATQYRKDALNLWRDVLLTCCLDGTIRLWSEIDSVRVRKFNKDGTDKKTARRPYHVISVIEINQCLHGTLGTDVFIEWAAEFGNIISKCEGNGYSLSSMCSEHDQVGKCEWLISVGPNVSVAFWALHCLDDVSPLRFPRVTLWKKQDLMDIKAYNFHSSDLSRPKDQPILIKAVALRSWPFGPPAVCSLLQLLPDNTVSWSQLYVPNSVAEDSLSQTNEKNTESRFAEAVLNQNGHTGKIIQLAIHPHSCEIELAVSLDANNFLLFWSLSTMHLGCSCTPMLVQPVWEILGKISLETLSTDVAYTSLKWAPQVIDEKQFLLLGHADGIDCFLIKISTKEKDILCHKILTINFAGLTHGEGPPDHIFTTPLSSICGQPFASHSFLIISIWMEKFLVLSWKVVLHSRDSSSTNFSDNSGAEVSILKERSYTSSFEDKLYYARIEHFSSKFPDIQNCAQVTSVAAVSSDNSVLSIQQNLASYDDLCSDSCRFYLATGFSDGTLKLWKTSHVDSTNSQQEFFPWELAGMFTAHRGPVTAVSLSSCSGKVATISPNDKNTSTSLHIWESVYLVDGGSYLLEDAISLNGPVVTLNWFSVGNGQLLLGVCMPNELRIYSEKRSDQILGKLEKAKDMHIWNCITLSHTYPVSRDFLWGPKVTPILVHEKHISVFSQWLFTSRNDYNDLHSPTDVGKTDEILQCTIFVEKGDINKENSSDSCSNMSMSKYDSDARKELHNVLDIADQLHGSLAFYHPNALLQYLYSGNWRRVLVVLKHLVGYLKSSEALASVQEGMKSKKSCHKIPEISLSTYLEDRVPTHENNSGLKWGQTSAFGPSGFPSIEGNLYNTSSVTSQKSKVKGFIDILEQCSNITAITETERIQILAIADLLDEIIDSSRASAYENLDESGRRFWVSVRIQRLLMNRKFVKPIAGDGISIDSSLIAWAFQSDCQDNLLNSVLSPEPSWLEMRNLGVGYWLTNASQLRTRMEKLARLQYLKNKDPKDCALLYLALNRLKVLAGLFKVSRDEKDKVLVGFLSRNFQEEKNKAAALKNAYVLMGRHQLELAIAFFLLGGDHSSAVNVCAKTYGDGQLALTICRLIEGSGGSLERHLISSILLPDAIEKGDYWLSSLFEWMLGNYSESFRNMLDSDTESVISKPVTLASRTAFSDPEIGQYCAVLAAKNCLKNSVGDYLASVLCKFSTVIAARALNRCGFPLEALESFSMSSTIEGNDLGNLFEIGSHMIFNGILNPVPGDACNWLLGTVACDFESSAKLNMVMRYISKFLESHPSWPLGISAQRGQFIINRDSDTDDGKDRIEECKHSLNLTMSAFERKYSLKTVDLVDMILVFACNKGLLFHAYQLLQDIISRQHDADHHFVNCSISKPDMPRMLLKVSKEIIFSFARYVASCSFIESTLEPLYGRSITFEMDSYFQRFHRDFALESLTYILWTLRQLLKSYDIDNFMGDLNLRTSDLLDLLQYTAYIASSWLKENMEGLVPMIHPILEAHWNAKSSSEIRSGDLEKLLHKVSQLMFNASSNDFLADIADESHLKRQTKQTDALIPHLPEDEMRQIFGSCLWMHISGFGKDQLGKFLETEHFEDGAIRMNLKNEFTVLVASSLVSSLAYVSSLFTKQLAAFLRQKALRGSPVAAISWLNEYNQLDSRSLHHDLTRSIDTLPLISKEDRQSLFTTLWDISVSPKEICENFLKERVHCFPYYSEKHSGSWQNVHQNILSGFENGGASNYKTEETVNNSNKENGSLLYRRLVDTDAILETRSKDLNWQRRIGAFQNPSEVIKRSGELLEALCINSTDEQQVVVASNRKSLLYFNWKREHPHREKAKYIWSESDWPQDGWAGCESTPIRTYVSPGSDLVSKREHLGFEGATHGLGLLARSGRNLTGGAAFGIPGYAGIGASVLGWGEEDGSDVLIDLPATVDNINSRALCRHPLRDLFLVGSITAHVYLWEFGKDKSTATYGVLPAPHASPPSVLASISALQFDHCGHRFATAAVDGTVCTWQLEVGGRSNTYPTQSSICFNNHATDVAYVSASGSILATAGCSSNSANVVVWDTLAPPTTSQASLVCHEGGARSLSVFDNDIGSGSVSPLIVTGGKSGDVGLHDFRFIATGRAKKHHRHFSEQDLKSMHETSKYSENANGMIWYMRKAHLGSVTKIATIPNTSLFLTGSKDGDVKLWDAKGPQLVFHWPKMHDRHTFLQQNSRGFGGVVRAAVTDIQVLSNGFLTCGADGSVKLVQRWEW